MPFRVLLHHQKDKKILFFSKVCLIFLFGRCNNTINDDTYSNKLQYKDDVIVMLLHLCTFKTPTFKYANYL